MWHCGTWFSGTLGNVWFMVWLDDLKCLLQPKLVYDLTVIILFPFGVSCLLWITNHGLSWTLLNFRQNYIISGIKWRSLPLKRLCICWHMYTKQIKTGLAMWKLFGELFHIVEIYKSLIMMGLEHQFEEISSCSFAISLEDTLCIYSLVHGLPLELYFIKKPQTLKHF